jgi:hypothetical protein
MIDEGTLAGLLADHAERIPVPASAIDALLAASPRRDRASAKRRVARPSSRVVAAAVIVLMAAGAVWAVADHSRRGTFTETASARRTRPVVPPTSAPAGSSIRSPSSDIHGSLTPQYRAVPLTRANDAPGATTGTTRSGAAATKKRLTDTARVVRTGTLDLRIARHGFGTTIGRVTTIAAAAGGFVADAKTFESAATPSGTVTIRIPSNRFNTTVEQLRKLGKVVSASTRGVDVTGQYTDLQARLRAASATRDRFLSVLSQATLIGDILAVQDRIQAVQTQIEQLQGEIQQLDDQATYGTITISVNEPGPPAKAVVGPHHPSGLSIAWDNARDGFARRVEGLISHSGSALVVLLGLLLAAGALRLLVPRMRRLFV